MSKATRATAARYGNVARQYRMYWAPAMTTLSRPLIRAMPVEERDVVLDVGAGVGAIIAQFSSRLRMAVALDVSEGMLGRAPHEIHRVAGDMMQIPIRDETTDGAFSTFALQHASRTGLVFSEVARALRPGGFFATATWGLDHAESGGCYEVLEEIFRRHRIPAAEPFTTWHDHVNEPSKMERYARGAGLMVERAWAQRSTFRWTPKRFLGWATTMGPYGRRLATMPEQLRARLISDLRNDLEPLEKDAFRWTPECVYAIAIKQ